MFLGRNPPLLKESRRTQCAAAFFVSSFYFFSIFIFSRRTFHQNCHSELVCPRQARSHQTSLSALSLANYCKCHPELVSASKTLNPNVPPSPQQTSCSDKHSASLCTEQPTASFPQQAAPVKLPQLPRGGSPPLTASACESAFRLAAPPPTTAPLPTKPFLYNFLCQILLNAPQDNPPRFSSPALNTSPACPNPSHFRLKKQYSPLTLNKKYLNDSLTFTFFVASPLIL